jgi:hypothetical protein
MPTVINLVATRSTDRDHRALARWYHDHVHLLMGFAALQRATLYQRVGAAAAGEPEYLCLYEFPGLTDFMEFEVSAARAQAQQVVQNGWARRGIEIVQRSQYFRLGRRLAQCELAAGTQVHHIQTLGLGAGPLAGSARWLADRVHCNLGSAGFGPIAWHRQCNATDEGGDALVMVEAAGPEALSGSSLAPEKWLANPDEKEEVIGQRPASVVLRWQGSYRRLDAWVR